MHVVFLVAGRVREGKRWWWVNVPSPIAESFAGDTQRGVSFQAPLQ